MRKTILWTTILLYGAGISEIPKDGVVSFIDFDYNVYKKTGEIVHSKEDKDVLFNDEVVATIEGDDIFAYSIKNGQLILAVNVYRGERHVIMYTIDIESKSIKKKERLNTMKNAYKTPDLEFSIIGNLDKDTSTTVIQYTWRGKTNKVILPIEKKYAFKSENYISENGHIVSGGHSGDLYVFSMDKKKFSNLGNFIFFGFSYYFYIPLNEYVIYLPKRNFGSLKIYLYNYANEILYYTTRYKKITRNTRDTIELNIKNGDIYEQFFPLTKVENKDSLLYINSKKVEDSLVQKERLSTSVKYCNYDYDKIRQDTLLNRLGIDIDRALYHREITLDSLNSLIEQYNERFDMYEIKTD